MEFYDEKIKALAIKIYELDAEVYKKLGSSLGRVFGGEKDICIRNIMEDLHSRQNSSRIRSELALISNMARTIPDHDTIASLRLVPTITTEFLSSDFIKSATLVTNFLPREPAG